jgi:hypothetical protein
LIDCDPLIIKADFASPNGLMLTGCIFVDRSDDIPYLVEVFVGGKCFGFNVSLPDIAVSQLVKLQDALGSPNDCIFPLAFHAAANGPDGMPFSGVFTPFTDQPPGPPMIGKP